MNTVSVKKIAAILGTAIIAPVTTLAVGHSLVSDNTSSMPILPQPNILSMSEAPTPPTPTSTPHPTATPTPRQAPLDIPSTTPTSPTPQAPTQPTVLATIINKAYKSCDQLLAAGLSPILKGQTGYRIGLDKNKNGIACDPGDIVKGLLP